MADDDDDPQLRSLRAAWRSMPDEDPPERGLAELMAAARQQADVMVEARAPWWKKLAATLLRPPVLALASVLILLGGLFVVTSSQKGVSPEPTPIEQSSAPASSVPSVGAGSAAAATSDTTIAPVTKTPPQPPAAAPTPTPTPEPARQRPPAHHAAPMPKAPARSLEEVAPAKPAPALAPEAAPPPPPVAEPSPAAGAAFEDDGNAAPATTRSPVKKMPAADVDSAETPRRQLDDQLLAQCRAAATRGDCEVARRLAKRIANDDAAYYQAQVVVDATIAPCLRP